MSLEKKIGATQLDTTPKRPTALWRTRVWVLVESDARGSQICLVFVPTRAIVMGISRALRRISESDAGRHHPQRHPHGLGLVLPVLRSQWDDAGFDIRRRHSLSTTLGVQSRGFGTWVWGLVQPAWSLGRFALLVQRVPDRPIWHRNRPEDYSLRPEIFHGWMESVGSPRRSDLNRRAFACQRASVQFVGTDALGAGIRALRILRVSRVFRTVR
eukprot:1734184-Rhodomonas_salina.1